MHNYDSVPVPGKPLKRFLVPIVAIALLFCYHLIYSAFYPAVNGNVGHDFSYFLPHLLDGYYWYLNNGIFSTQWYTAAFCGGVPVFPSPITPFNSVPQWLMLLVGPLQSVYLTHLIFAALGFAGFYLLLRNCFKTSVAVALFGAAVFLFNGFHAYRMVIGHLTYHAFMLTPLIAYFLLRESGNRSWFAMVFNGSVAAVLISYMLYSGMFHLMVQSILVLVFIGLLHNVLYGNPKAFWIKISLAGVLSGILSLPKIVASLAFLANFPRSDYLLPGADSLWSLIKISFSSLFLSPFAEKTILELVVNRQWELTRHEFEYGITIVPLIFLLVGGVYLFRDRFRGGAVKLSVYHWLALLGMFLICIVPFALNLYTPGWNAFLKEVPMLRNSSNLFRWWSIYIPVVILLSALAFDRVAIFSRYRNYLSAAAMIAVVALVAISDKAYYKDQPYSPDTIVEGYQQAKKTGTPPMIGGIFAFVDQHGRPQGPYYRNDVLVKGFSQMACYEPVFGYRLEHFPVGPLVLGPVNRAADGVFNIKNPACYVYPNENNCAVGAHFTVRQPEEAQAFVNYKPYPFAISDSQKNANIVAIVGLIVLISIWLGYAVFAIRQRPRSA